MRGRLALVLLIATALAAGLTVAPSASAASTVTLPATCTVAGTTTPAPCTLTLVGFTNLGGTVGAVLRLTNDLTGQSQQITVPITNLQQAGTCTILDLTLGPIDLTLLGLRVQTNEIHLLVTAQRGTLLGDLLCGLFFNGTATQPLIRVLNALLAAGNVQVA